MGGGRPRARFARTVAAATGAATDRSGRVIVEPDLTVPGHPEIFVVGDAAVEPWKPDHPTPGVAQGAMQGGSYAAKVIRRRVLGRPYEPFRYSDHGDVAVIGRLSGVTNIGWLGPFGRQGGFPAWALWLGIHIFYLIGFSNRIVVLVRWAWTFLTHGRSTRLITGQRAAAADRGAGAAGRWRRSSKTSSRRTTDGPPTPVTPSHHWPRSLRPRRARRSGNGCRDAASVTSRCFVDVILRRRDETAERVPSEHLGPDGRPRARRRSDDYFDRRSVGWRRSWPAVAGADPWPVVTSPGRR